MSVWKRNLLFGLLLAGGAAGLAAALSPAYMPATTAWTQANVRKPVVDADFERTLAELDASFRRAWKKQKLVPAPRASDLTIIRRVSLATTGTIPSLEEIRRFEASPSASHIETFVAGRLDDPRHHAYFAERLARPYVGTHVAPIIVYRRRRFTSWLAEALRDDRPYDVVARELIASTGLATNEPAINFLSSTIKPEEKKFYVDENELAARVARVMLGVRIDCAQCHDHPFEPWKQSDFQSLAAFFGQSKHVFTGLQEVPRDYQVEDRKSGKPRTVEPRVPFQRDLLPAEGSPRQRLAAWITHPKNERFARAIVNRVWALMFGRGLVEPIDDIQPNRDVPEALDILARDFTAQGYHLRRLIDLVCRSEVFQLDSRGDMATGQTITDEHEAAWAVFPLRRLRSEQIAASLEQASRLQTIDGDSHLLFRIAQAIEEADFVKRYGDAGEDELHDQGGAIPQRLLLMNGKMVLQHTRGNSPLNAAAQIAMFAPDDVSAIETAYLAVLTRRPTPDESNHFLHRLQDATGRSKARMLEDVCWTLINSTEFSWNH